VTANEVTLAACGLSLATGAFLSDTNTPLEWFLILPPVFLMRMILNALDGIMAREFALQSFLGVYLNELVDVASDAFLILPWVRVPGVNRFWIAVAIALAGLCEMTGVIGVMIGASRRYDGPMGKSDRAAVLSAVAIWVGLALPWQRVVSHAFAKILSILIALTIYNRVRAGLAEADSPESPKE